ncbi:MAG: insulinase family protein [Caldilineae bacterium]|nr:insulinase family protein [Caldilineae bacterium]
MPVHGFELIEERQIPEINSLARRYRHIKTGARLLSIENDDENKLFCIAFATPPDDSTGLPHILEHSVLCGSETFPVKEPFKELRKGSLNTFLNAFTAPDRTMYPVASQNRQDFYNLVHVYLDAVFKPFLTRETLQTQGWHYETDGPDAPLTFKGVVFNEMKGVYSSPDSLIGRYTQQSLFPDTIYSLDSGGDPAVIPDLTYEQFREFHRRTYHPSNAMIFFYGDDHSDERFGLVDQYLSEFERAAAAPEVAIQPRLAETRRFVYGFDAGPADENGNGADPKRSYVTINWMLNEIVDIETTLALQVLSHALVGTQASPLRKALIDSGLGDDLTGGGYGPHYRQAIFSTGLMGIAADDADQVETLVLDTLAGLAADGIDPDTVAASLNTIEFRLREANTGAFPRGLMYAMSANQVWQHGGDPMDGLAFEDSLNSIKRRAAGEPRYFEALIDEHLLDNKHRTVVLLQPDAAARERSEAAESARLEEARAAMSAADVEQVLATMQRLKAEQDRPDSSEAVATIPTLTLADLDREARSIPIDMTEIDGASVLTHDIFTNGIVYLDLAFDLRRLPQRLLPYGELFGRLLLGMGTESEDFVVLSQRIGRETGGIGRSLHTATTRNGQPSTRLILRGKATQDKSQALLDILRDILLTMKLDNPARFRQIVLEEKAGVEASLIPGGHRVVLRRLRARYSVADWVAEENSGIDHLLFLRRLAERVDNDWAGVLADLEAVRAALVSRAGLLCNVTLDAAGLQAFLPQLAGLVEALPDGAADPASWTPRLPAAAEGLTIPAQVNYVGKAANLYELGYELNGAAFVAVKLLDNTWMWDRVRVQGGAYGGFLVFDNLSGVLSYLSYRDPNLLNTLQIYDGTAQYLRDVPLTQDDVDKIIIGVIGQMDSYQLPDAKGLTSMVRHLTGYDDALRQRLRDEVLATTVADVRAFADLLDEVARSGSVAVLGSAQAIAVANESLDPPLVVTPVL